MQARSGGLQHLQSDADNNTTCLSPLRLVSLQLCCWRCAPETQAQVGDRKRRTTAGETRNECVFTHTQNDRTNGLSSRQIRLTLICPILSKVVDVKSWMYAFEFAVTVVAQVTPPRTTDEWFVPAAVRLRQPTLVSELLIMTLLSRRYLGRRRGRVDA